MTNDWQTFYFLESAGSTDQAIFLLHGTGGGERDLLPFVERFRESHHLVSLLGNVREGQMARFFARFADGSFDRESLEAELSQLAKFVSGWHEQAGLDPTKTVYVGYSNGANFLLAFILAYPQLIKRVVLMHPMVPLEPSPEPDLTTQQVLVTWSRYDKMVAHQDSLKLIAKLEQWGAEVKSLKTGRGHFIDRSEVIALGEFIDQLSADSA